MVRTRLAVRARHIHKSGAHRYNGEALALKLHAILGRDHVLCGFRDPVRSGFGEVHAPDKAALSAFGANDHNLLRVSLAEKGKEDLDCVDRPKDVHFELQTE